MNKDTDFDLNNFFPYRVRMFYKTVNLRIKNVCAHKFELKVNEWRTMANIDNNRPLSAKEIVTRSSISKVNVSRAITSLQKKGLLDRHVDPTDRRRILLRLTPKGKKIMTELVPLLKEQEKELLSPLNEEEVKTLSSLMARVQNNSNIFQTRETCND